MRKYESPKIGQKNVELIANSSFWDSFAKAVKYGSSANRISVKLTPVKK